MVKSKLAVFLSHTRVSRDPWTIPQISSLAEIPNSRLCFYQSRSAWSMDQGSTRKRSAVHNFAHTVTKFCVMWEGLSLPHDTKFGNCRGEIVDRRMIFIWSLIHGSGWSGLIKAEPGRKVYRNVPTWSARRLDTFEGDSFPCHSVLLIGTLRYQTLSQKFAHGIVSLLSL